jgi:hypothetical protein
MNDAAHVRAGGREFGHLAVRIAIGGDALPVELQDLAFAALEIAQARSLRRRQLVLQIVLEKSAAPVLSSSTSSTA